MWGESGHFNFAACGSSGCARSCACSMSGRALPPFGGNLKVVDAPQAACRLVTSHTFSTVLPLPYARQELPDLQSF